MNQYQDLIVWQKARILVKNTYTILEWFPKTELFGLTDQMKRAVISIPSNIAEWNVRATMKEQSHFLYIARGSCAELETQIILATDLWFIKHETSEELLSGVEEISKMLVALIKTKKTII
jgi:four helix bundle protein